MSSLEALFESLAVPPLDNGPYIFLTTRVIPGHDHFRIAKDRDGHAVILARVANPTAEASPSLVLEYLRVDRARSCRIQQENGSVECGVFTVLTCATHDTVLRRYFLAVSMLIIESTDGSQTDSTLRTNIEALVELFRSLQQPARKSAQGLWAELFLILRSPHPDVLIRAWHSHPDERFDFCIEQDRIEVKSTVGPYRKHHFAQAQLDIPHGADVVVASLLVARAGGGVSVRTMIDRIGSRISSDPALLLRVESVVAATLGSSIRASSAESFDLESAEESLRLFDARTIPHVLGMIPAAISELRFVVDMSQVQPVDAPALCDERKSILFNCLLRTR